MLRKRLTAVMLLCLSACGKETPRADVSTGGAAETDAADAGQQAESGVNLVGAAGQQADADMDAAAEKQQTAALQERETGMGNSGSETEKKIPVYNELREGTSIDTVATPE